MITTTNPRTGVSAATDVEATSAAEVDRIAERAHRAAFEFAACGRAGRARMLDAIADSLDATVAPFSFRQQMRKRVWVCRACMPN